ncbi:AraC family transcriptional regulator [Pseudomonas aeruginosa]|uniref:AraC family transcriptional regulator n=1 Tax=Pseudomonas aeruginosa TaxID=287 RepID=UPI0024BF832A|nr:AraC family transcriptional regulator [Pseudomonas aeruginosa]WHV79537.1 AraC family transcriptional regulator [Pseudomonas aeruginosa]
MLTSSSTISVPMRYVCGLVDAAASRGVSSDDLLAWASIDRVLLDLPKGRVSLKQFSRLYGGIVAALEDEGLGLQDCPSRPGSSEMLCRIGVTTSTFADCASVVARGCNVVMGGFKVECISNGGELQISFRERDPTLRERELAFEIVLLMIYSIMSWLVGQRLPLVSADFPYPPPRHLFELRALLGGRLRFNQPHAALRFSGVVKNLQIVRSAEDIPRFIRRAPASFIEALVVRDSLAFEVRRVLQQALPELLSLIQVAERLAVSRRTLHRKLEASGASFQGIKDDLRRDIALNLLTRSATPLKQIAETLGFSDQSTFQRAFAEWTGVPPGEYRKRAQASE